MVFRLRRLETGHGTRRSSYSIRACSLPHRRALPGAAARGASQPGGCRTRRRNVASPDLWAKMANELDPHRAPLLEAVTPGSHSPARIEALKEAEDRFAAAPGQMRPDEAGSDPAPRDSAEDPSRQRPGARYRLRTAGPSPVMRGCARRIRRRGPPVLGPDQGAHTAAIRSMTLGMLKKKMPAKAAGMETAK